MGETNGLASGSGSSQLRLLRSPIASEKLQYVVPEAYQIPLRTYLAQPTQQKLLKPSHLFDLTEIRFTECIILQAHQGFLPGRVDLRLVWLDRNPAHYFIGHVSLPLSFLVSSYL